MTLKIPSGPENIYHTKTIVSPSLSNNSKLQSYNRSAGGVYSPENIGSSSMGVSHMKRQNSISAKTKKKSVQLVNQSPDMIH